MATWIPKSLRSMSPSARKASRVNEGGGSRVVQNEYEKAVATGRYAGSMDEFAKMRGMRRPK